MNVRPVFSVLVASQCLLGGLSGAAIADETKWRLARPVEQKLMLYTADTDEATDALGNLVLDCKPGSGLAKVDKVIIDKNERAAVAKLVLNDTYPTIEFNPGSDTSALEAITNSDGNGWGYQFQLSPDAPAFESFKKTGTLKFKIGGVLVQSGIKAGLDKIAEFQTACRTPSDRPKASK